MTPPSQIVPPMHTPTRSPARRWRTRLLLAGATSLLAMASVSCGGDSEAAQLIRKAEAELTAIGGGETTGNDPLARSTYQKIVSELGGVVSSANEGDAASASLVLARAHLGLGEAAAERAVEQDAELRRRVMTARHELSAWLDHQAEAASLETFDPSDEYQEIAARRSELTTLLEDATAARDELQSTFDGLRENAERANASAQTVRDSALAVEQEIAEATATRGAQLAPRLRQLRRQGDEHELAAGDLTAQADLLAPQLSSINLQMQTLQRQIAQLDQRRVSLEERATERRRDAASERQLADGAADRFDAALGAISTLRRDALDPAVNEATSALDAAIASSRRAQSLIRQDASRSAGAARRRLGDVLARQAEGLDGVASLLETAANAEPAPPNTSTYRDAAAELRTQEQELLERAAEAFESAASELAAGADSDISDRLERVMAKRAQVARGASIDLEAVRRLRNAPVEQPSFGGESFQAGDRFSDASTPEGVLQGLVDQIQRADSNPIGGTMGAMASITQQMRFDEPELDAALAEIGRAAQAMADLDGASQQAFGASIIDLAAANPQLNQMTGGALGAVSMQADTAQTPTITMDDFQITDNGDSASVTATNPDTGETMDFTMRPDPSTGEWYIDLSPYLSADGSAIDLTPLQVEENLAQAPDSIPVAMVGMWTPLVTSLADAFEGTAQDTLNGTYDDGQTMVNALVLKIQPIVMQAMSTAAQQNAPSN
ncbi:MAG: hypothetical protein AAGK04_10555 [Planctomycetota bacterium]